MEVKIRYLLGGSTLKPDSLHNASYFVFPIFTSRCFSQVRGLIHLILNTPISLKIKMINRMRVNQEKVAEASKERPKSHSHLSLSPIMSARCSGAAELS